MIKLENLNFTLPEGTTNHGDAHLLCFPATWNSIAVFIIGNYIAHAATVKTPPASSRFATVWIMLGALLVPSTGLVFGMSAFYQARKGRKQSDLRKATLARALCMYVRADDWYSKSSSSRTLTVNATVDKSPFSGKRLVNPSWRLFDGVSRQGSSLLWSLPALCRLYFSLLYDLTARHVFCMMKAVDSNNGQPAQGMPPVSEHVSSSESTAVGQSESQHLAETAVIYTTRVGNLVNPDSEIYGEPADIPGYVLAYVPIDSIVEPLPPTEPCDGLRTLELLTKRRDATKSMVALLQLCFSVFVLVRARGDQVALYGMAAFSLTVAPYAVMAAVNLLANAIVPRYDCLFLVENDVMKEMRSHCDGPFVGVVGTVQQTEKGEPVTLHPPGEESQGEGAKWVSGVPGFHQDARLRLFTPNEAISNGVLPDICITISAAHETKRQAHRLDRLFQLTSTTLVGLAPFAIISIISKAEVGRNATTTQLVVQLIWTSYQQLLGILVASSLFLAQGRVAVPAPHLWQFWSSNNRLLTPELFRRLGFHDRVYGSLHHQAVRLLYIIWIHVNTLPLRLLALLRYPFAVGDPFLTILFFACFIPAIWGFVIVGKMLNEYGNCVRVY